MPETVEQLTARIEKIDAAIEAALTGKKYRISSGGTDRELERQSLKDLQALRQLTEAKLARMSGSTIRHVVPTP